MRDIRAISFDCYGTLVDWESGILAAFRNLFLPASITVDDEALLERFAEHEAALEAKVPIVPYYDVLRQIADGVAAELNVTISAAQSKQFAESIGAWPLFDDVLPALEQLHDNFTLAILSNVDRRCFSATEKQFAGLIDIVCIAEDTGAYKPDTAAFLALLDNLQSKGIPKAGLLHVAQSLYHDHAPAQNLGIQTCWVDRRHNREGWGAVPQPRTGIRPDHTITGLDQLITLMSHAG